MLFFGKRRFIFMRKKMKRNVDQAVFRRTAVGQKRENLRIQARGGKRF